MIELYWLPKIEQWRERLRQFGQGDSEIAGAWDEAVALANARLDFGADQRARHDGAPRFAEPPQSLPDKPVRLALLGSCTMAHLHPGIRVAALRRRMWVDTYENDYGQYWQELADPGSGLHKFKPTAILFALDAYHLASGSAPVDGGRRPRPRRGRRSASASAPAGGWRRTRSAAPSSTSLRRRCIRRCSAATSTGSPGRGRISSPGSMPRCGAWPTRPGSRCWRSMRRRRGTGFSPGTIRSCGTAPSRRSTPPRRRCTASWWRVCSPPAGALLQMPGARPRQHAVGRRRRRRRDRRPRARPGQRARRGVRRLPGIRARAVAARRHPGGLLQERRGQRARAVREASGDGAEARRHRQLRRQLDRQGRQHPRRSPRS